MISPNRGRRHLLFAYMGECVVNSGIEPMWIKGIEDYLLNHNCSLIFCNLENNPERARIYMDRFAQIGIDGIFFLPMSISTEHNIDIVRFFQKHRIPVILIDRAIPGLEAELPCVMSDHFDGGRQITQHLLSLGHRRIAFFHTLNMDNCSSLLARYRGYQQALREAGIEPDPELTSCTSLGTSQFLIKRWMSLPDPPTAIFVEHDLTLARLIEGIQSQGIGVPEELSLAGFDDIPMLALPLPHTTIQAPKLELGQTAAMQLLDIVQSPQAPPQTTVLPVSLIIRQTTGINRHLSLASFGK
jgi:DNA-binding LacI/PurR family transcriptional regulator